MGLFDRFKKPSTADANQASDGVEADNTATETPATEPIETTPPVAEAVDTAEKPEPGSYRKVRVNPGRRGWGVGLVVAPEPGRDLIYSVTGGGIHPVAQRIADMTGGTPFDGFRSKADFSEIACAVIDCGGTARIGVYPMKGVLTIDIHGAMPSGPLMRFINEENFVSGSGVDNIEIVEE